MTTDTVICIYAHSLREWGWDGREEGNGGDLVGVGGEG